MRNTIFFGSFYNIFIVVAFVFSSVLYPALESAVQTDIQTHIFVYTVPHYCYISLTELMQPKERTMILITLTDCFCMHWRSPCQTIVPI